MLSLVAWLAIFFATATTTEVARNAARGAARGAARAVGAAYTVAAGWGVVTAVALVFVAPYAAWLLGARGEIGDAATEYARISALGLPFLYLSYAGNGHLTGQQDTSTPLRIAVGANVLNVALESVLVFGLHSGLAGFALGHRRRPAGGGRRLRPGVPALGAAAAAADRADMRALLRDGHRLSVRRSPRSRAARRHRLAARLGPVPLAGQQVAYRVWYLLSLSLDALAVPAQVYVSAALGTGDQDVAPASRPPHPGARPGGGHRARRDHHRARVRRAPGVHGRPRGPSRRGHCPGLRRAHAAARSALAYVYDGIILGLGDYTAMRRDGFSRSPHSPRSPWRSCGFTGSACPASGVWRRSPAGWPPAPSCSAVAGRGPSANQSPGPPWPDRVTLSGFPQNWPLLRPENVRQLCKVEKVSGRYAKSP